MMIENIAALDAGEQLQQVAAISLAIATVMAPKDKQAPLRRETKRLRKVAYPEVKING